MRVLLLSHNRVVHELVKLGLQGIEPLELEIPEGDALPRYDRYDLVFEEDRYAEDRRASGLEHLLASRRILLGGPREPAEADAYDRIVPKPFLPEDIRTAILGPAEDEGALAERRESLESFLEKGEKRDGETEILDEEEIRRIRRLLEGEIEETPPEGIREKPREISCDFDEFLGLLEKCRVKKLKRLLKGSRVHITIEFPEEER